MSANARLELNLSGLKIKEFGPKVEKAVGQYMEAQAPRVQDYARSHAPWSDQTGNARQGLFAKANSAASGPGRNAMGQFTRGSTQYYIDLYHTVSYGIWLEVRWAGKYRIIVPTIQQEGMRIMSGLGNLFGKLGISV